MINDQHFFAESLKLFEPKIFNSVQMTKGGWSLRFILAQATSSFTPTT